MRRDVIADSAASECEHPGPVPARQREAGVLIGSESEREKARERKEGVRERVWAKEKELNQCTFQSSVLFYKQTQSHLCWHIERVQIINVISFALINDVCAFAFVSPPN
jgi:hypothetical protein